MNRKVNFTLALARWLAARRRTPASDSFSSQILRWRGEYTLSPAQGIAQLR